MWEPGTIGNINLMIIAEFTVRYTQHLTLSILSAGWNYKQSVLDAKTSLMISLSVITLIHFHDSLRISSCLRLLFGKFNFNMTFIQLVIYELAQHCGSL